MLQCVRIRDLKRWRQHELIFERVVISSFPYVQYQPANYMNSTCSHKNEWLEKKVVKWSIDVADTRYSNSWNDVSFQLSSQTLVSCHQNARILSFGVNRREEIVKTFDNRLALGVANATALSPDSFRAWLMNRSHSRTYFIYICDTGRLLQASVGSHSLFMYTSMC